MAFIAQQASLMKAPTWGGVGSSGGGRGVECPTAIMQNDTKLLSSSQPLGANFWGVRRGGGLWIFDCSSSNISSKIWSSWDWKWLESWLFFEDNSHLHSVEWPQLITATMAGGVHQQIQSLLLEKAQWQSSSYPQCELSQWSLPNQHSCPSNTFNLPSGADAQSKNISQGRWVVPTEDERTSTSDHLLSNDLKVAPTLRNLPC